MAETSANTLQATQSGNRIGALAVGAAAYTTRPGDLGINAGERAADGAWRYTRLDFNKLAQTITNGVSEYTNTLLYTFPIGIITFGISSYSLTPTTTSTIATTITSGASGTLGFGTAVASNATLATTMINVGPGTGQTPTAWTSSTVINVAAANVTGYTLAFPTAVFDGSGTAIKLYLNNSVAVNIADGTMTWDGYLNLVWCHSGDI